MKKILLLAAFLIIAGSFVSAIPQIDPCASVNCLLSGPLLMHYYVNGTEVDYNQVVSTTNPFEYKITLANDDFCCDKTVLVIQTMSHKFDILSSNQTYSKVSGSVQDQYVFDPIVVPKNSGQQIILNFQNTAPVSVRTEPFTTSMEDAQGFEYNFQLFLVRLDVPAIPEFPLVALPIGIVLGSFFIISRRKK